MNIFFQAFFRDVSALDITETKWLPLRYRRLFLCAGISEDELRYSCTASFQKTIWQTPTYKAVCLRTGARNFKKLVVYAKVKVLGDHHEETLERFRETFIRFPRAY